MASHSFSLRFYQFLKSRRRNHNKGFTLTELLVSIIISAIIVSGLLYLVVELLGADARESARNETQREMQLAMNYITTDLREAVYVYDDVADIADGLPDFAGDGMTPILAFWKPVYFTDADLSGIDCDSVSEEAQPACDTLLVRRSAYSLIVYLQEANPDAPWSGQSVIRRYELSRYEDDVADLSQAAGYVDPTGDVSFQSWPLDSAGEDLQDTEPTLGSPPVLIDFVAAPGDGSARDCEAGYTKSPATSDSFFACVRASAGDDAGEDEVLNTNQDVFVFLQGDVQGRRGGNSRGFDVSSRLPVLQSQVLVGGVIDKDVAE
ncbi:MAG: PulJ/GspJ family protein [Thainema sp.]